MPFEARRTLAMNPSANDQISNRQTLVMYKGRFRGGRSRRTKTGLLEIATSVRLEGGLIRTRGMVFRITNGRAVKTDARAVEMT